MKVTIFLMALAVAGLLQRAGYPNFALGLLFIALVDFIQQWFRDRSRR